jgi:TM2 domain-containing membrane protein YozV
MENTQGSAGNVIAALCSLFIPGLGQLVQGRLLSAIGWFLAACLAYVVTLVFTLGLLHFGWFVVSIFSCINAASYRAPGTAPAR